MTTDYTKPPAQYIPPPPPGGGQPQQKSSGCWKWGLIGCGVALVIIGVVVIGLFFAVFGLIKSTRVYKDAVHRAETNPQVIAAFGTPIKTGFFVSGHIDTSNNKGSADVNIPISGPKQKGTIHCVATLRGENNWRYDTLVVEPEHGPPIDLLATPAP